MPTYILSGASDADFSATRVGDANLYWLVFAILTAVTESLKDVGGKFGLKKVDEYLVTASMAVFGALFIAPLLLFIERPPLGEKFFLCLFSATTLYTLSLFLYFKALRLSDLSITVPMIMYTPVFLLLTSPLMLGEQASKGGIVGVLLIVSGSYLMNISARKVGILGPFKALLQEPGPRVMLSVAFIWSITSNIDKAGLQSSTPMFWIVSHLFCTAILSAAMIMITRRRILLVPKEALGRLLLLGFFHAFHAVCYITTLSLSLVVYGLSMKRTSVLISIILGKFLFNESGIRERFFGAALMLVGMIVVIASAT